MKKQHFPIQIFNSTRIIIINCCITITVIFLVFQSRPLVAEDKDARNISFGIYQADKASTMYRTFQPIINALVEDINMTRSEKLSISIKIYNDYKQGISGLATGDIDFMRMGPASYILAKEKNPMINLLVMESIDGKIEFNGIIIVPQDSEINEVAELHGKNFAFGNSNSTLGRYLSQAYLVSNGIYAKNLSGYEYLGRHDKVAYAVGLGDYDAGAVKEKAFKKESKKGTIRAIASFKTPTQPWVARAGLEQDVFNSIQNALLSLKDKDILKYLKVTGFATTDNSQYDFVRKGMQEAHQFTE